jgi:predicted MFS family arabinose efflux permease
MGFVVSTIIENYELDKFDNLLINEADVLVATPEKMDLILRLMPEFFDNVSNIIFDEGHVLGNVDTRSSLMEFLITRLKNRLKDKVSFVFISAVMPDISVDFISQWLSIENENNELSVKRKFGLNSLIATEVVIFALVAGLFSFANSVEYTYMALYAERKGIENISMYFIVSAVFILISRLFAGRIYDRKGLSIILYPAMTAAAVGMMILGSASGLWMFLFAAAFKAAGQGAGQPSLQTTCLKSVKKERIGLASSTYYLGPDTMQGIGPIVGGFIIEHAGYEVMYFTCSAMLLAGMVIYMLYVKKHKVISN